MRKILAAFMLAIVFSANANADVTIKMYREAKQQGGEAWEKMKSYVTGAGSAFQNANVWIVGQKQQAFYCQPRNLGLNTDNLTAIIDSRLAKLGAGVVEDHPVSQYLMFGLIDTFPCPKY